MSTLPPTATHPPDDDGSLLLTPELPPTDVLSRPMVLGGVGLLVVALFAVMYYALQQRSTALETPTRPVAEAPSMAGTTPPLENYIKIPTSFANLDRRPPPDPAPPEPPPAPPIPPMFPVQAPPVLPPLPPAAPPPPARQAPPVQQVQAPAPKDPPKPRRWLLADLHQHKGTAAPPFPVPEPPKPSQREEEHAKADSGLVHPVNWVTPLDPTRWLYAGQVITGLLLNDVNSDLPGLIRLSITRPVYDRFGQHVELIPQHTIAIGQQQGTTTYGQARLDITMTELQYPDGTIVGLSKAKLADRSGAVGAAGHVNEHFAKIGIAAVLSALLNVGARQATVGNTTGFNPTIQQQAAADIGQSANQSAQGVVQRQLGVKPTITITAGEPVTIQLSETLSFAEPPTLTK
jgi:type IV secretion system protein VirB10